MKDEYNAMLENQVWSLIKRPKTVKANEVLDCKWVFVKKYKPGVSNLIHKARLVIKGFKQIEGRDYENVYAPTLNAESLKLLIIIAISLNFKIVSADFTTAYLNSRIDKKIFMKQPEGFVFKDYEYVLELKRGIYGLKQGGYLWYKHITNILSLLGFEQLTMNSNIFINKDRTTFIGLYVDDLFIVAKNLDLVKKLIEDLTIKYKLKLKINEKVEKFLGLELEIEENVISLHQKERIKKVADKYKINKVTRQSVPIILKNLKDNFDEENIFEDKEQYQSIIGVLLFTARMSRPDIQFYVNQLSRYNINPKIKHYRYALQVLEYLYNTIEYSLKFKKSDIF